VKPRESSLWLAVPFAVLIAGAVAHAAGLAAGERGRRQRNPPITRQHLVSVAMLMHVNAQTTALQLAARAAL